MQLPSSPIHKYYSFIIKCLIIIISITIILKTLVYLYGVGLGIDLILNYKGEDPIFIPTITKIFNLPENQINNYFYNAKYIIYTYLIV